MKLFKYLILLSLFTVSGTILSEYILESVEGENATIVKKEGTLGGSHNVKVEKFAGTIIDTAKNEVEIENDICAVCSDPKNAAKRPTIVCKSGKVFEDVCTIEGSATGTPPWLSGEPNYIGQKTSKSTSNVPGSAKRIAYFKCNMSIFAEAK